MFQTDSKCEVMIGEVQIRSAVPEDVGPILEMLQRLARHEGTPHPPRLTAEALRRDAFGAAACLDVLIASKNGEAVGFLTAYESYSSWEGGKTLHIGDLWVEPEMRGMGLGKFLIERIAQKFPARRIDVYVVRDNPSRKFYERMGFNDQRWLCLYRRDGSS